MADVFHWQGGGDQAEAVRQAAERLDRGELVAFPGGVAASVLSPQAVERLTLSNGDRLTLALPNADQALEWVPAMKPLAQRLARRLWPGSAILLFGDGWSEGLVSQLDATVRDRLCAAGQLALSVPAHPALWYTLLVLPVPLVVAASSVAEAVTLRIEDQAATNGQAPLIRIQGEQWEIVAGEMLPAELQALARCRIVFVCTGNTCRSPMAAALCRKLLADRLGCGVAELAERGYEVDSAGIAALPGDPAASEAVEAVRALGADLAGHASQPLTPQLARQADHLITMTQGHQLMVLARYAQAAAPRTLCPRGGDVADPIGAGPEVYQDCARQILGHLNHWIAELERPCA